MHLLLFLLLMFLILRRIRIKLPITKKMKNLVKKAEKCDFFGT
jgi:hypothetical protein